MKETKVPKYKVNPKGQVIIYYGDGKGKTTAALGLVLRAAGMGWRCKIFQFIKGPWPSAERDSIKKYLNKFVKIETGGKGFVKIQGDKIPEEVHKKAARDLLEKVQNIIDYSGSTRLIVLDEILDAVELGFISEKEIIKLITKKNKDLHLVITGHKKYPAIFAKADLITQMKKEKHPFDKKYLAIRGLDY